MPSREGVHGSRLLPNGVAVTHAPHPRSRRPRVKKPGATPICRPGAVSLPRPLAGGRFLSPRVRPPIRSPCRLLPLRLRRPPQTRRQRLVDPPVQVAKAVVVLVGQVEIGGRPSGWRQVAAYVDVPRLLPARGRPRFANASCRRSRTAAPPSRLRHLPSVLCLHTVCHRYDIAYLHA